MGDGGNSLPCQLFPSQPAVWGGGGSKIYISPTLFRLKPMWIDRFNLSKNPSISTNTLLGRQRNFKKTGLTFDLT